MTGTGKEKELRDAIVPSLTRSWVFLRHYFLLPAVFHTSSRHLLFLLLLRPRQGFPCCALPSKCPRCSSAPASRNFPVWPFRLRQSFDLISLSPPPSFLDRRLRHQREPGFASATSESPALAS